MGRRERPVAFFDSGLGGISVLRAARRALPRENYLYYGDSKNAPYGEKTPEEILRLSEAVMARVLDMGAKAVVIACNTATGVAVDRLRKEYPEVPILGVEPAVKPAAEAFPRGTVLVMATPACLEGARFAELLQRAAGGARVVPVPCGGLMEFVERGEIEGPDLRAYLREKLRPYEMERADAVVLGCTHYPFLRKAIREAFPPGTALIDGSQGVAAELRRRLSELGLLNPGPEPGRVDFYNSLEDPEILRRSRFLLELPDDE